MSNPERPVDDHNHGERGQSRGGVRGVLNELLHGRDDTDQHPDEARTEQTRAEGRPVEAGRSIPGAPGYRDPAGPQHAAPAQHGGPVRGTPAGGMPEGGGSALPPAPGPQNPGQQLPGQQVPGQQPAVPAGGMAPDQSYAGPQAVDQPGSVGAGTPRGTEMRGGPTGAGAAGVGAAGIAAAGVAHSGAPTDRRDPAQHTADRHTTDRRDAGHAAGAGTPAGPSAGEDSAGRERLVPAARAQEYGARWDAVKGAFVDEPRQAVQQADVLVGELLDELERLFRDQRRGLEQGLDADETSTEDLRLALRRYRSFFDRLLSL